ncbi:hypothetical protein WNY59_01965 [Ahrensia kielensis]|uniref:Uncharacterized protein n=1 Tax=Ahrensia kielensis TaxID=76980 RepID=A0ABU9T2J5_9HYPH
MMQLFSWTKCFAVVYLAAIALGGATIPVMAANVSFVALHYSADRFVPQFHFDGPVVEGDTDALSALIDKFVECTPHALDPNGNNCAVVTLNSPGGNYIEGLRLAALMRERAIATVIEETAKCYSACAFAFLGGTGYSSQEGVGAYIDRMIEPGGILGFHAPYFAPDALGTLVAEFGLDKVLGASRDDISLMIQQLVDWNVNPNALSHIVRMGPSQTYDIVSGGDYTLLWAQLPPAPSHYWNSNMASAVRNACINLLAHHLNTLPNAVIKSVSQEPEIGLVNNEQGQSLVGYRLEADSPLAASYCALPQEQFESGGEIDLALYTAAGVSGTARPLVSLFNRTEGWSTMGAGGNPTRRNMQKGSMSHLFVGTVGPIESDFVKFMSYLPLRKFARFNQAGGLIEMAEFPVSELPMTLLGESKKGQVLQHGEQQVIVETGSELLYNTARHELARRYDVAVTLTVDYDNGFVVGGFYDSKRPYLWVGLKGNNGAATLLRIETPDIPLDMNAALKEQEKVACSFKLHGYGLGCP